VKHTEQSIQDALTAPGALFCFRKYASVPNVSWGLWRALGHETDLLCLSKSGCFHEVEIKISKSDLRADAKKRHRLCNREPPAVRYRWFAVPSTLATVALSEVDARFGIVEIQDDGKAKVLRRPKPNRGARKPTDAEIVQFLRLGVMRMWSKRKGVAS
jgi:hypothetical protein